VTNKEVYGPFLNEELVGEALSPAKSAGGLGRAGADRRAGSPLPRLPRALDRLWP